MPSSVIIGGGHNGLITAVLLAKKGHKVTVFEGREQCGGVAESIEFAPGFRSPGILHDTSLFDPRVVKALNLQQHGLKWAGPTRRALLGSGKSPKPLSENKGLSQWFSSLKPVINSLYGGASPDLIGPLNPFALKQTGLAALKAGRSEIVEWARLLPQCAEDTVAEWVDNPEDRALWMLPSLFGTYMAPLSPSSTVSLGLYWALTSQQVAGGPAAITTALLNACKEAGVTVKTKTPVSGILMEKGRAVGVRTQQGEHQADQVVSTIGVATTGLHLLPPGTLAASVEQRLLNIRSRGCLLYTSPSPRD